MLGSYWLFKRGDPDLVILFIIFFSYFFFSFTVCLFIHLFSFGRGLCKRVIGIKSYYGASGSRKKKRWQDKIKWRQSVTTQRGLWNRVFLPSVKYSWERVKRNMFYKMQERNQYNKCQCGKPTTFFFLLSYLSKVNNFI